MILVNGAAVISCGHKKTFKPLRKAMTAMYNSVKAPQKYCGTAYAVYRNGKLDLRKGEKRQS
jgi:hypothetical protein